MALALVACSGYALYKGRAHRQRRATDHAAKAVGIEPHAQALPDVIVVFELIMANQATYPVLTLPCLGRIRQMILCLLRSNILRV